MSHILLLVLCLISVEVLISTKFMLIFDGIIRIIKRVIFVLISKNISDHWKEKILPIYALGIMKYSLQIFIILMLILLIFTIAGFFYNDLLLLIMSLNGAIEAAVFSIGYLYLRNSFVK